MQKKKIDEEIIEKEPKKVAKKNTIKKSTTSVKTKSTSKKAVKKVASEDKVTKSTIKKATDEKKAAVKKTASKNAVEKKSVAKKTTAKKADEKKSVAKKTTAKKAVEKKSVAKKTTAKKADEKKTVDRKTTTKKVDENKSVAKKSTTKKADEKKTTSKKVNTKTTKRATKKASSKSVVNNVFIDIPEYYDLPYRYNETTVKVLAQNPNTLFVYWDVSDNDRINFENQYGKEFFYITKPVLVIHNLTEQYTYEIEIDDFANNWYVHVNDTKCKYIAELGRKPINQDDQIAVGYINVYFSNEIETPNDHVLFYHDNQVLNFKNIYTGKVTKKIISLNNRFKKQIQSIYDNYDLTEEENYFDLQNPSSQNPTSTFK